MEEITEDAAELVERVAGLDLGKASRVPADGGQVIGQLSDSERRERE